LCILNVAAGKVIVISISDAMAHLINDVDDVETHLPGCIKAIREYFRDYKSFSGKINTYALRAQAMPRHYAVNVIETCHNHWKQLHVVDKFDIVKKQESQEKPLPISINTSATPTNIVVNKEKIPNDLSIDNDMPNKKVSNSTV
jgi:hypothetical protein